MSDYLVLDEKEKENLKKPLGTLYKEVKEAKELKGRIISVGDAVSYELIKAGIYPDIAIVDGKIGREKTELEIKGYESVKTENPAGRVTKELWDTVKKAIHKNAPLKIEVKGEEDLAVIPAVMNAPEGTKIVYGQPGEGIVVVEVNEQSKKKIGRHLLEHQIREGKRFLEGKGEKVIIVHHSDADGCSSAGILKRVLKGEVETISPKTQPYITEDIKERIREKNPDTLIIVDMGNGDIEYLKKESAKRKVAIFDHHKIFTDTGELLIVNPCKAGLPDSMNPSASYFVWKICDDKETSWLAALGVIGDKGEKKAEGLIGEVIEKYGVSIEELKKCAQILDSAEASEPGGANLVMPALMKCDSPRDLLEKEDDEIKVLREKKKEIEGEIKRLAEEYIPKDGKLISYGIKTKYGIKGDVANLLQEKYPDKMILVYIEKEKTARLSMRTYLEKDLATAIKKALGPGGKGGGHPKAAGAEMPKEEFEGFIERLKIGLEAE